MHVAPFNVKKNITLFANLNLHKPFLEYTPLPKFPKLYEQLKIYKIIRLDLNHIMKIINDRVKAAQKRTVVIMPFSDNGHCKTIASKIIQVSGKTHYRSVALKWQCFVLHC